MDHFIYRVEDVREVHVSEWSAEDSKEWAKVGHPDPDTWPQRPRRWAVTDHHGERSELLIPAGCLFSRVFVVTERFAICACCGEPWPCVLLTNDVIANHAALQLDWLCALPDGACWECGKLLREDGNYVRFRGENLMLPGGSQVGFHLTGACGKAAKGYEARWVKAEPNRVASLDEATRSE